MPAPTRTRIKVCGMTDPQEAVAIVNLGVDALGFIFVKESPRYIDPERARAIVRKMPPFVHAVGVFMNEDPDVVNDIVRYCGLSMAQLHGDEPAAYCQTIVCPVIKAFRVKDAASLSWEPYAEVVTGILLDTYRKGMAGGTGETFDWRILQAVSLPEALILAGGLNPENVGQAIAEVRPFAVDVNSGVEFAPGRKDISRVSALITQVMAADHGR